MSETTQLVFTIAAAVFDMIITMVYFKTIFKYLKYRISKPIYYMYFIGVSAVFWIARSLSGIWIFFMLLSLFEIFLLTLIYESKLIIKCFSVISLQVFAMLSEITANSVLKFIERLNHKEYLPEAFNLYGIMLSKLIKFIIVLMVMLILKKNTVRANFKDYLCLMIVPFLSIFIIIAVTIESNGIVNSGFTTNIAILGILIINFIVYYLLNNIIKANEIREKQTRMETQFMFQEKKYEQTAMSFKSIIGLIHDTNKHLIYLRECVAQKDYGEAIRYINVAISNIDNSYKRINTGFLVIDALVSNALNTAHINKIDFKTDIKIDKSKIDIERYDLSVTLGNLLDNAIEACIKVSNLDDRYINVNIFTTDTALVINIINSAIGNHIGSKITFKTDKKDKVRHGYGLGNVNMIAEKYGGSFTAERKESKFEATVVLPLVNK